MSKYQLGLYEKATPTDLSWEERLSVAGESGFDYVEKNNNFCPTLE